MFKENLRFNYSNYACIALPSIIVSSDSAWKNSSINRLRTIPACRETQGHPTWKTPISWADSAWKIVRSVRWRLDDAQQETTDGRLKAEEVMNSLQSFCCIKWLLNWGQYPIFARSVDIGLNIRRCQCMHAASLMDYCMGWYVSDEIQNSYALLYKMYTKKLMLLLLLLLMRKNNLIGIPEYKLRSNI